MRRSWRILGFGVVVCLVFSAGYLLGTAQFTIPAQAQGGQPDGTQRLFRPFWEVWNIIKRDFVDESKLDDTQLMEAALTGMVNSLDDVNTAYMPPSEFSVAVGGMQGEYEGIGATVRKDEATGGVLIVSTTAGSPAREVLRQGDIILFIEGEDITQLSLTESVGRIRGPAGTSVRLGVARQGNEGILEITVQRAKIVREIVTHRIYDGDIGYLALTEFTDNSAAEVARALRSMNANRLNGLVLDLRNDPGGGLQTSIDIASQFLRGGTVVIQRGRPGTREIRYPARGNPLAPDVPMVVIVNEASASASELVAGALQDRGRARVVGTYTFRKGSIQQWQELSNGGGLRVTIAEFFKPSGGKINHIGIIPDVLVPWTEEQARARPGYDPQLTEALWLLQGKM